MVLSKRTLIQGSLALLLTPHLPAMAAFQHRAHVLKARGCGCCNGWIDILKSNGFHVTAEDVPAGILAREKQLRGIPSDLASCHTALVGNYVIEGHVPPADILRLLAEQPKAIGLAVPGMPYGSPGMGPESEREPYDVFLIRPTGGVKVFSSYGPGASAG